MAIFYSHRKAQIDIFVISVCPVISVNKVLLRLGSCALKNHFCSFQFSLVYIIEYSVHNRTYDTIENQEDTN